MPNAPTVWVWAAGLPPTVMVLTLLAYWARPLALLLGLLAALRGVHGAQRVQAYAHFSRTLRPRHNRLHGAGR